MRIIQDAGFLAAIAAMTLTSGAAANAPDNSYRPVLRPPDAPEQIRLASAQGQQGAEDISGQSESFATWRAEFELRAMAEGIDAGVLTRAFAGVTPDPKVIERDRNQSEFTKTIWQYLETAVSDTRIDNGQSALAQHRQTLTRIEAAYGVDAEVVVAIWGLESAYGAFRGSDSTIQSLVTLAYDARRRDFFEEQLMAALQILQDGHVRPENMTGSWAGAMGHTQFMPTSFQAHAVDFTGDGKRDIWSDDPTDAFASTAAYLKHFGWTNGQPWGVEVRLPQGFDYTLANRKVLKSPSDWGRLGISDMDGRTVPDHGPASILLPAGGKGAAFMIFGNFAVIERYNTADAYVIGVGHLADRIAGGPAIRGGWPLGDRALSYGERKELQERLTAKGFDTQKIDGRIGPLTINAVREYQLAAGLLPDGYASLRLLEQLR